MFTVMLFRSSTFLLGTGGRGTVAAAYSFLAGTRRAHQSSSSDRLQSAWQTKQGAARIRPSTAALFASTSASADATASAAASLPDLDTMRAGQIKQELESYGISTKSFLEKSELVDALRDARAKVLQPKPSKEAASSSRTTTTASASTSSTSSSTAGSSTSSSGATREQRLTDEVAQCQALSAKELRNELKERGISTASFFEKSELVKALAEARVDGVVSSRRTTSTRSGDAGGEEGYAEYKNVEVLTDDASGPRAKQSPSPSSSQGGASPFGGGANPFGGMGGGGANPFGGAGGMGGIADMLKNMGMGGGGAAAGASPFGGMGANPFGGGGMGGGGMGDMMGKAQELMKNPKVRDIMMKAQSNPRIMAKVTECMSNPASLLKYQNDPEVAELISELKKYM
jgi:STI1 domain